MAKLDQISTIPNLFGYFGSITTTISQKRFLFTFSRPKLIIPKSLLILIKWCKRQTGRKLKIIRTDNGTELSNRSFKIYCGRFGILVTNIGSPWRDGTYNNENHALL